MKLSIIRNQVGHCLRRFLQWRNPLRRHSIPTVNHFEVEQKIFRSHTNYLIRTEKGQRYFRILEPGTVSLASVCRSYGTELVGKLLGLESLHPQSELVSLPGLGDGILQAPAEGISILPFTAVQRRDMLTGAFQKEINNLNLLDVICYETDHSPNNYLVKRDSAGKLVGLSVFDNNGVGVFACRSTVCFYTYKKISLYLTEDGCVRRPHMSRQTANNLEQISFWTLYQCMRCCLKPLPILFLYRRISILQKAVRKTAARDPSFLLDDVDWNESTIQEELSGTYGKTYLVGFLQDCVP